MRARSRTVVSRRSRALSGSQVHVHFDKCLQLPFIAAALGAQVQIMLRHTLDDGHGPGIMDEVERGPDSASGIQSHTSNIGATEDASAPGL